MKINLKRFKEIEKRLTNASIRLIQHKERYVSIPSVLRILNKLEEDLEATDED